MFFLEPSLADVKTLIDVSQGSEPADLYIRGGTVANVYSGEYIRANVAVKGTRIAYVGLSEASIGDETQLIDASGRYLCPGYIEAHGHPWVVCNPVELSRMLLPLGTTSAFNDTLFFFLLMDYDAFHRLIATLSNLPMKIFWGPRIAPQSVVADESSKFTFDRVREILELPNVASIFEITRWAQLLKGDQHFLECIALARSFGKRVDGHTAGCSYEKLNPVVAAGVDSCHEAIDAQQALDRLRLGMYVFLRDSSLREDLRELIRIVTENKVHTGRLVLTTDGSSPTYFADKGSVEHMAEVAVDAGVDPMAALQMITLNPATYYHLDHRIGGIGPGRVADININHRLDRFKPELVVANGKVVAEGGKLVAELPALDWTLFPFDRVSLAPGARVLPEHMMVRAQDAAPSFPVMDLVSTVITRRRDLALPVQNGFVDLSSTPDLLYITVLGRHGGWATNGVIKGFARDLEGLATSFNTSGDVLVLGTSGEAMALAANRLYELGGGIILAEQGRIIYELPLELGGMMSSSAMEVVVARTREALRLLRERGYPYDDLLYTMLFLPCDFLPEVRVTSAGLFDVKTRRVLRPRREIR